MTSDGHSWNSVWPPNLTEAAHAPANTQTAAESRREMFSPYGRGSRHVDPRTSSTVKKPKRSGSAPPALSRKSLSEFVSGGVVNSDSDPYKTPVNSSREVLTKETAPIVAPTAPAAIQPVKATFAAVGDVRDVSAAVSRWANKSLAELMAGKGVSTAPSVTDQS